MTPAARHQFEAMIRNLPGSTLGEQWEAVAAKVGGKVFALMGLVEGGIVFKVSVTSFAGLTSSPGIGQAPYFAKGQWVKVASGALDEATLRAYIEESHRIIAAKLTRKVRAELGL